MSITLNRPDERRRTAVHVIAAVRDDSVAPPPQQSLVYQITSVPPWQAGRRFRYRGYNVLIQVHHAGICGTDIHILKGEYEAKYPLIPGHEFSGTVVAVGSEVTRFKFGDRVTADPNIPCNRCPACQRNEPNQCYDLKAVGVTRDGASVEYVSVPEDVVFPIGQLSFAEAALVEPLACVAWGLERVVIPPGGNALVLGVGPMGCLLPQAVRSRGASRVVVADIVPRRLRRVGGRSPGGACLVRQR